MSMKLLSLWQPWASAMAWGWKGNETRSWSTKYRGEVAIHAAKQNGTSGGEISQFCIQRVIAAGRKDLLPPVLDFPRGKIVAVGQLVDVWRTEEIETHKLISLEREFGDYSPKRFVWIFSNVRRIAPMPYKGSQGLRDLPEDVVSAIEYLKVS